MSFIDSFEDARSEGVVKPLTFLLPTFGVRVPEWLTKILILARILHSDSVITDNSIWFRLANLSKSNLAAEEITVLINDSVNKLKFLSTSEFCIIPTGIALDANQTPIFFLMIFFKCKRQKLEICVINTSSYGIEYHDFRFNSELFGNLERNPVIIFKDVCGERVCHSSFWLSLYRLLIRPAPQNIQTFYSVLLTHTNQKPLYSNWSSSDNIEPWITPPTTKNSGSCVPAAIATFNYILKTIYECEFSKEFPFQVVNAFFWWALCVQLHGEIQNFDKNLNDSTYLNQVTISHFSAR